MRRPLSVILLVLVLTLPANASTIRELEFTCPLDGTRFTAIVAASGTSFGINLDLMPHGPIIAPSPIPKCPADGLVLYKKFTDEELQTLRGFVTSPHYAALQKEHATYYLVAKLEETLGIPRAKLWYALLQATWQAEGEQYRLYAEECIDALNTAIAKEPKDGDEGVARRLVLGELHRRLGDFQRAEAVFTALRQDSAVMENRLHAAIVAYQLELVAQRDSARHQVPKLK